MKINIAAINIQSGVATKKGMFQYPLTVWKYWLPHSHKPFKECGEMIKKEEIDIACLTEISNKSVRTAFRSQTDELKKYSELKYTHFFSSQRRGKFFAYEGNAMLSPYPLSSFLSHLLPIELMRMSLEESTMEMNGRKITVFLGHLALGKKSVWSKSMKL